MLAALVVWLICIAGNDLTRRKVPNTLVVGGAVLALLALGIDRQPLGVGWLEALGAATAGFLGLLAFYVFRLMGAADVKFAAALGLWVGLWPLAFVWTGASLLAGLHALVLVTWRRYAGFARSRRREIPYAAYMAAAAMGWIWQHHMS